MNDLLKNRHGIFKCIDSYLQEIGMSINVGVEVALLYLATLWYTIDTKLLFIMLLKHSCEYIPCTVYNGMVYSKLDYIVPLKRPEFESPRRL